MTAAPTLPRALAATALLAGALAALSPGCAVPAPDPPVHPDDDASPDDDTTPLDDDSTPDFGIPRAETVVPWDDQTVRRTFYIPGSGGYGEGWAVSLFHPDGPSWARWPEEGGAAPVVLVVPGTFDTGDVCAPALATRHGLILVQFAFPGGPQHLGDAGCPDGFVSSGSADQRGPESQRALRDVALFALGRGTDARGRTISEVLPELAVLTGEMGIAGVSNGGNTAAVALSRYAADLAPGSPGAAPRWVVFGETPFGSALLKKEPGIVADDLDWLVDADGNGIPTDDMVNPYRAVVGCPDPACGSDYTLLRWDPDLPPAEPDLSEPRGGLFWDGDGDGAFTAAEPAPPNGGGSGDVDRDGVLEAGEDFALAGAVVSFEDGPKLVFSTPSVAWAVAAPGAVFGGDGAWPDTLATLEQTLEWWDERDGSLPLADLAAAWRDGGEPLRAIVAAGVVDHVLAAPDYPHVRLAYDTLLAAGAWVRLNAGAEALYEALDPWPEGAAAPSWNTPLAALPPCDGTLTAGCHLEGWTVATGDLEPLPGDVGALGFVATAAVIELVDRVHGDDWD